MKKVFIGLLIVAVGAGIFFVLRNKKNTVPQIDKGLLIGSWKNAGDSSGIQLFDFQEKGVMLRRIDSLKTDTVQYAWSGKDELTFKATGDSISKSFAVLKLSQDSLQLRGTDSIRLDFVRLKILR